MSDKIETKRYPMAMYSPKVTLMSKEVADLVHGFNYSDGKKLKPTFANIHRKDRYT